MQNVMFILIAPFIFFISLNGMMPSQDQQALLSSSMQVLHSLITKVDLDHNILCSLAINKQTEKWLRETASRRKDYLRKHISHKTLFEESLVTWHKYGSACGRKQIIDSDVTPILVLNAYYLQQNITLQQYSWNISRKDVLRDNISFFNEDGNICCYGLEDTRSSIFYLGKNQHVLQCCLPQNGTAYEKMLGLQISPNCSRPLSQFISFPILLKALLQTKKTKGGAFELCDINNVTIPDGYKTCNPCDEYQKFEDLPKKIQSAVDNRYQQQLPRDSFMSLTMTYR